MISPSNSPWTLLVPIAPLLLLLLVSASLRAEQPISIFLNGAAEVPPVATSATASGQFTVLKGDFLDKLHNTRKDRSPAALYPPSHLPQTSTDQAGYQQLVALSRDEVLSGSFEKVVPSRCKEVPLPKDFDAAALFTALCTRYPSAMVSVFSSPLTGTWIGATPEMLVSVDARQHFHTVAVAGTQRYVPGMDMRTFTWTQKEIEVIH